MPDGMIAPGLDWGLRRLSGELGLSRGERHPSLDKHLKTRLASEQNWRCCGCGARLGLHHQIADTDEQLAIFVVAGSRQKEHDGSRVVIGCDDCSPNLRADLTNIVNEDLA